MDFLLLSKNKSVLSLILLVIIYFITACSPFSVEDKNAAANPANHNSSQTAASDNLGELMNVIRLPELPDEKEVVWKIEKLGKPDSTAPGPTDTKLVAVLKYDDETAARLVSQIEKHKAPEHTEIEAENWFPEELTAQAQISGNETLKGTAYGANDFVNIPYGTGRVIRVEGTNYFVLELFTT